MFPFSQLLGSLCGHDPLAGIFHPSCSVMEASLGIQVDEPMAFSPLRDRLQVDGSLKNYEQSFKLSGMCAILKMDRQPFCDFKYLKTHAQLLES